MEAAAHNSVPADRDKAQAGDVHSWLMKLINTSDNTAQTPPGIWEMASPFVRLLVL